MEFPNNKRIAVRVRCGLSSIQTNNEFIWQKSNDVSVYRLEWNIEWMCFGANLIGGIDIKGEKSLIEYVDWMLFCCHLNLLGVTLQEYLKVLDSD